MHDMPRQCRAEYDEKGDHGCAMGSEPPDLQGMWRGSRPPQPEMAQQPAQTGDCQESARPVDPQFLPTGQLLSQQRNLNSARSAAHQALEAQC